MTPDATSLDRLHDLALPAAVPWWPPAPGWYAVLALLGLAIAWLAWRSWKSWQINAYRRAARRELATLRDAPAIAELLRRTALAVVPRSIVAERSGAAWVDWLVAHYDEAVPDAVRRQLTTGVYERSPGDVGALRDYADRWITFHRIEEGDERPSPSPSTTP